MSYTVGIDVGGTFTDMVVIDERNNVGLFKTPTIPEDPVTGLFNCISKAAASLGILPQVFLGNVGKFTFGTTIATNALLQGKGATTGLITTRGFKDTLPVARLGREYLPLDLHFTRYPPLIPRNMIEEVTERVDRHGSVITPLNLGEARSAIERHIARGAEAIAICFLWSFQNSCQEREIKELLQRQYPDVYISLSSEVAPILGEYERTATVVMNSMLGPFVKKRLGHLSSVMCSKGLETPLLVMQSNGGLVSAEEACVRPLTLVNSGPVGGVVASKYLSGLLGCQNLIGIDMGGTSFDVNLITKGEFSSSLTSRINNHNVYVPTVDVHSIGAGGGSIARADMGRVLKVGPMSAGAVPGPACYAKGGTEPTVTDADLVLGRLDPQYFLGGEISLDLDLAWNSISKSIAKPLGIEPRQAAAGICQVVDAAMAEAVRLISVRKGRDPREYVLVAFGGAGPLHAAAIASELGITTVIVPYIATVQSAFGIAASDIVHSFAKTELMGIDKLEQIGRRYKEMETQGLALLRKEGVDETAVSVLRFADMRYRGQDHEITVPLPTKKLTAKDVPEIVGRFEERYQSLYGPGTIFKQATIEVVTLRADVVGATKRPVLASALNAGLDSGIALSTHRQVYFPDANDFLSTPIYKGEFLKTGNVITGPAVVQYPGTTAVINPKSKGKVDSWRNLIVTSEG